MKILPKENLLDFSLPLPLYSSIHIADAISKTGEEFEMFIGLDKKYAEQLKVLSIDESDIDLQSFTGDKRRFVEKSYEHWYKKNRTPFALIHKQTDSLAAIIWCGPKAIGIKFPKVGNEKKYEVQNMWHTVSMRSYPNFRGEGLMTNFAMFVIDIYKKKLPNSKLWAGMDDRNVAMVKLSSSLGFEKDEENSDLSLNWLVFVLK